MKAKYLFIISITFLNLYAFGVWLWVFNTYSNQKERVEAFLDSFVVFNELNCLDFILSALTLISLILAVYKFKHNVVIGSVIIHVLFLLSIVWSRL